MNRDGGREDFKDRPRAAPSVRWRSRSWDMIRTRRRTDARCVRLRTPCPPSLAKCVPASVAVEESIAWSRMHAIHQPREEMGLAPNRVSWQRVHSRTRLQRRQAHRDSKERARGALPASISPCASNPQSRHVPNRCCAPSFPAPPALLTPSVPSDPAAPWPLAAPTPFLTEAPAVICISSAASAASAACVDTHQLFVSVDLSGIQAMVRGGRTPSSAAAFLEATELKV